jgi:hypothetical protein
LPEEFLDQLDTDLDNRIDYDGGEYWYILIPK